MKKNKNCIAWGLTAFLVIVGSMFAYYALFHLENLKGVFAQIISICMPIIDGLVLAYLLTPLVNFQERKFLNPLLKSCNLKLRLTHVRAISVIITYILAIVVIYGFMILVIPQVTNSLMTIVYQFPAYVDTLIYWVSELLADNPEIETYIVDLLNHYSQDLSTFLNTTVLPQVNTILKTVTSSFFSVFNVLWDFVIGIIISIYVLFSKEKFSAQFKKVAYAVFQVETANRFIHNLRFSNKTFGGFFVGKILDSAIIGVLCFICTSFMGTPFYVLVSVIIGVTNIIPFFGPFIGAIPCTILILFAEPIQALYFVIFILILQQVDGNIIGPKILGDSTGLSSFWVIFSITLFGGLFGLLGMIIGVPVFAVLFAFIKSSAETKLAQKGLPTETSTYMKLLYIHPEDYRVENFSEEDKKPSSYITNFLVRNKRQKSRKDTKSKTNTKITDEYDGE
ncbi:MAG: AI-2E family transporter [Lachnospiraceae bacterium]|nr:AI-2E family transporter [Lachnospiraceae bacterium]